MMKRLQALLMLVALLLAVAACAKPSEPELRWTGKALEGVPFLAQEVGAVVVHYTARTTQTRAEQIGRAAGVPVQNQVRWGSLLESDRLDLWIVPADAAWPAGLPAPPPGRRARAAGPLAVVAEEGPAAGNPAEAGLPEAVTVAANQPQGSPAYQVDWLHEGMGGVLEADPALFPATFMRAARGAIGQTGDMLKLLTAPGSDVKYRTAAMALATLVMDRWGVDWTTWFPRPAADLSPVGALLWAIGGRDQAEALSLWQERIDKAVAAGDRAIVPAMADMSPVRAEPKLAQLPPGPGPNANYSPHAYTITARYEPEQRRVAGEETLTWTNGEGIPVDTLYFNLWANAEQYARYGGAISIGAVTVDGTATGAAARGLDLTVPLGRAVAPGQQVAVRVPFTTRLPGRITARVLGQEKGPDRFNLAHWFPILAVLDDRGWNLHAMPDYPGEPYSENASFQVTLDVPSGMVLAATGHPVSRTEQGDRWIYRYDAPDVKDWIAAGGRDYAEDVRTVEGVTIHVIDKDRDVARTIGDETERTLKLFQPQFGPYPYPDLAVVPCCAYVEYPGLFFTESSRSDRGDWWHTVLYHEFTHQWFYGEVGNDQYSEAWLDEGFARYGERYGLKAFGYTDQLRDLRTRVIPPQVHVNSSTLEFNIYGGYTQAVYDRGALVLEDLEELLGKEQFRRLLGQYTAAYRFKTATTADFMRLAEQVSGRDLSGFFRDHQVDPGAREPYRPVMPLGSVWPR